MTKIYGIKRCFKKSYTLVDSCYPWKCDGEINFMGGDDIMNLEEGMVY